MGEKNGLVVDLTESRVGFLSADSKREVTLCRGPKTQKARVGTNCGTSGARNLYRLSRVYSYTHHDFGVFSGGISLETNEDWLQLHTPITFGQIWRRRKMNVDEQGKRNLDRKSDFRVADKAVV